jgi:copper chaperone CopZ
VKAVSELLGAIEGIENVSVDLARGEATFSELNPVDQELLRERLRKAGYELG